MAKFKDIIIDDDGDISFFNGDFKVKESDSQHVEHIMISDRGQFRQFPLIGVGIYRLFSGSPNVQFVRQQIKLQLESDGYNVRQITINPQNITEIEIDAERKNS